MALQFERDVLEHLYVNVTTDIQELWKNVSMYRATFYRNIRVLQQGGTLKRQSGSGRPQCLDSRQKNHSYILPYEIACAQPMRSKIYF